MRGLKAMCSFLRRGRSNKKPRCPTVMSCARAVSNQVTVQFKPPLTNTLRCKNADNVAIADVSLALAIQALERKASRPIFVTVRALSSASTANVETCAAILCEKSYDVVGLTGPSLTPSKRWMIKREDAQWSRQASVSIAQPRSRRLLFSSENTPTS